MTGKEAMEELDRIQKEEDELRNPKGVKKQGGVYLMEEEKQEPEPEKPPHITIKIEVNPEGMKIWPSVDKKLECTADITFFRWDRLVASLPAAVCEVLYEQLQGRRSPIIIP